MYIVHKLEAPKEPRININKLPNSKNSVIVQDISYL
jgi:hypothetical protein